MFHRPLRRPLVREGQGVRFSKHSLDRLAERGITAAEVQTVLESHEVSFADPKGNACYVRTIGERRIKVVVAADDPEFVITVIDLNA